MSCRRLNGSRLRRAQLLELLARDRLRDELEVAVRNERDLLYLALGPQPLREVRQLARVLYRRAASVDHACEQELVEPLRHVAHVRQVEVDPDRFDGEL